MLLSGETRYETMLPEKITTIFWMGFSLYLGTVRHFLCVDFYPSLPTYQQVKKITKTMPKTIGRFFQNQNSISLILFSIMIRLS